MKFQLSDTVAPRLEAPLAPMISIAFLLLLFFTLGWKPVSSEHQCVANLPVSAPAPSPGPSTFKVGLRSDGLGNLTQLTLNGNDLGNDDAAFEKLNQELLKIVGRSSSPLAKDIEVELDADFECQHKYVVKAISQCAGRFDPQTQQVARYVERIKFTAGSKPRA
jgi:biopolymer transport protein ExbD